MPLFMVETVSVFRHRFVVDAKNAIDAQKEVNNRLDNSDTDLLEFSQTHVDENVITSYPINQKQYLQMFDQDNDYLKKWPNKEKLKFINKKIYTK